MKLVNFFIFPLLFTNIIYHAQTGKVGINTATPDETLDINGTLKIRNTAPLSGNISGLYVDSNGLVGVSGDQVTTKVAYYAGTSSIMASTTGFNNLREIVVPIDSSHQGENTLGIVHEGSSLKIAETGVYSLSSSFTFALQFEADRDGHPESEDGYMYISANVQVSRDQGLTWTTIAGARPIFPRLSITSMRSYSYTVPTAIQALYSGDLLRMMY